MLCGADSFVCGTCHTNFQPPFKYKTYYLSVIKTIVAKQYSIEGSINQLIHKTVHLQNLWLILMVSNNTLSKCLFLRYPEMNSDDSFEEIGDIFGTFIMNKIFTM